MDRQAAGQERSCCSNVDIFNQHGQPLKDFWQKCSIARQGKIFLLHLNDEKHLWRSQSVSLKHKHYLPTVKHDDGSIWRHDWNYDFASWIYPIWCLTLWYGGSNKTRNQFKLVVEWLKQVRIYVSEMNLTQSLLKMNKLCLKARSI